MGKNKQPPTDMPGSDPAPMTVLPSALPADMDPYALLNAGHSPATVRLPDFPADPDATVDIPVTVAAPYEGSTPTVSIPPVPVHPPLSDFTPDMADPRVRALYVNQGTDVPPPSPTADPLLVTCLQLFERIFYGRLLSPFAHDCGQQVMATISQLRERVCQTPTKEVSPTT